MEPVAVAVVVAVSVAVVVVAMEYIVVATVAAAELCTRPRDSVSQP